MTNKYRAIATTVDGIRFASKREAKRFQELKLMQRAGQIEGLELQPKFDLIVNDIKVCRYVADFRYKENGKIVTEDCKGYPTPHFRTKWRLMKAVHGIEVRLS